MIGELLQETGQIAPRSAPTYDALVFGGGPSFFSVLRCPLPKGLRYGCGIVTQFLRVDVYALGDPIHAAHVPSDAAVYATQRVRELLPNSDRWRAFPEHILPHGGSSGGMALSLACQAHNVVGLIGFDGYGVEEEFARGFRELIRIWQRRGKRLISLMPDSAFHEVLERA